MKKGDPSTNGSDLNNSNIIKPTLDHLSEKDRKTLEAYHKEVDEVFLSCYEVTRQGLLKMDVVPIIICKSDVTPEVKNNPSLSLDDIQFMINSALERQSKSSNEKMYRGIGERDGKKS
jgi:regulator of RNase E activity RraB